jgi:hypothetical protein
MYMVHDFKLIDTNVHSVVNASKSWLKNYRSYGLSKHPDYEVSTPGKRKLINMYIHIHIHIYILSKKGQTHTVEIFWPVFGLYGCISASAFQNVMIHLLFLAAILSFGAFYQLEYIFRKFHDEQRIFVNQIIQ